MPPTLENRRPKFVSFSGIDGAGKSTQIENLRASLAGAGLEVTILRFWDDVAKLKGIRETTGHKVFKGDKGVGSPEAPINRRDKNVQSAPMTAIRLFLYLVDTISLRNVLGKALRSGVDVVICDRYTYDELANLSLKNALIRIYARMLLWIAPRPDIRYLLDADPDQARARKPEYPLDFLKINRAAYLSIAEMAGMTVIPPGSIAEASRKVVECAFRELSIEEVRADAAEDVVS